MLSNFHFLQLSSHRTKMTPAYLLLLGILSKCALAALQPPLDPYVGDTQTNYIYERACHHYAVDQSSRIYESGRFVSRMLEVYYHKCLSTIWPRCEVVKMNKYHMAVKSHKTFERKHVLAYNEHSKPVKTAHKRGFLVGNFLDLNRQCLIFWDARKPPTDTLTFYKLKLHDLETLSRLRLVEIANVMRGCRRANMELAKSPLREDDTESERADLLKDSEAVVEHTKTYFGRKHSPEQLRGNVRGRLVRA